MNTPAELLKQLRIDRDAVPEASPWRRRVIASVMVLVVAALIWQLTQRAGSVIAVQTGLVTTPGTDPVSVLDASGYVVARRMATVAAKVTGRLTEVLIEEGMRVDEGQVLARLESTDADAHYALAQAQQQAAQSRLAEIRAQLLEAQTQVQRLAELLPMQWVARAQYDQALAARDTLQAQLASAQRNLDVSRQNVQIAEIARDNTIVYAPFSGVVIAKAAQPGEIISPLSAGGGFTRTGVCTIVDMDSLEVEVDVGEAYIGRVQPRMPVAATLNAYPDWSIPAEVIAIIPAADRGKATVRVRIALLSKDPRIVPDMGVKVGFLETMDDHDEASTRLHVPRAAVVQHDNQYYVFVLNPDHTVSLRPVRPGRLIGTQREIQADISAGDTVILDPPPSLKEGQKVSVGSL